MATNENQATQLLEKLRSRTGVGTLKWERSIETRKYQARMGEFIMQIGPDGGGISLVVRKLSGAVIDTFSTSMNSFQMTFSVHQPSAPLSNPNRLILESLYAMIDDHNDDLDELIKML